MLLKGTPINETSESDLSQLISDGVVEDKRLEFKREPELSTDGEKKEFLRDVTAMANASGGVIIYGIEEDSGQADSLHPLSDSEVDDEIQRMDNLLRTSVTPRIHGHRAETVDVSSGGRVILLGIPRSPNAPHQVQKDDDRFYIRTSNSKHRMDPSELRQVVELSINAEERIRRFRENRIGKILSGNTPIPMVEDIPLLAVHLIPLSFRPQRQRISVDEDLWRRYGSKLWPMSAGGHDYRYNVDGLLTYFSNSPNQCRTYVQLFRTAAIEAVAATESGNQSVPLSGAMNEAGASIRKYLEVQKKVGVDPPVVVSMTLLRAKGYTIATGKPAIEKPVPFDREVIRSPEVVLQTFDADLKAELKPTIVGLWNAGGLPNSPRYDSRF